MIAGPTLPPSFTIVIGLAMLGFGPIAPANAQTGQNEQAAGIALGRRVESSTNGTDPTGDLRVSSRLQTRVETRLQTRIERFSPQRADARFAYRMPIDDGSRRRSTNTGQQLVPVVPEDPLKSIVAPKTETLIGQ